MDTKNESAGSIKVGNYVVFDNVPCVVKNVQKSKTGKHGAAKCRIEAVGLFEDKKIIKVMPASDNVQVPIVEKKSAQVLSVQDNTANVMDLETYESFDLEIPDELKDKVVENAEVVYWTVLGKKVLRQVK
jgi:translation initiation factor 5A